MSAGTLNRIARTSSIVWADGIARAVLAAAIGFWMAHALGPERFGMLNYASAFMAIGLGLASLGMDTPVVMRLARGADAPRVLGTLLGLRVIAAAGTCAVLVPLAWLIEPAPGERAIVTMIACLAILAYVPSGLELWFRARSEAELPAAAHMAAAGTAAGARSLGILQGLSNVFFGWVLVLEAMVASAGAVLTLRTRGITLRMLRWNAALARSMLKEAMPYLLTGLFVLVYMKIDLLMLGLLASDEETGIYAVAQKLSEVLYMVPVALAQAAFPFLVRAHDRGGPGGARAMQAFHDGLVLACLAATACALLVAGPLIGLVFGERYARSVDVFHVHAWSCVPITLSLVRAKWLALHGLQRLEIWTAGAGAFVNVALNFVLIPRYGATGAAVATVVSYFVAAFAMSFLVPRLRPAAMLQVRALWAFGRVGQTWQALRAAGMRP